jgi:hypothetical protein
MLARVLTVDTGSRRMPELVQEIRETLPRVYGQVTGYRGMVVLEQDTGTRIIAASFWDDEDAMSVSEHTAADNAQRIGQATGTTVSVESYEVLGSNGIRFC